MEEKEKKDLELLDKIDKYLNGSLDETAKKKFEAEIKADSKLSKKVEMNRIVNEAIKNKDVLIHKNDILETMAAVKEISGRVSVDFEETEKDEPKKKSRKIGQIMIGIAATVLLLLVAVFVFRHYTAPSPLESQVAAYLEDPYISPPLFRGAEEPTAPWVISYAEGDYQAAKSALENIVASGDPSPEALFYLGLCYLYQANPAPENAVIQFNRVLGSDNRYGEQALWYQGLAYILAEQYGSASEALKKLSGFNQNEARLLLDQLE